MRRWSKKIFIGSCLALALIAAGFYLLTHWRSDTWTQMGPTSIRVELAGGALGLTWSRVELFGSWDPNGNEPVERPPWPDMPWEHRGEWLTPNSAHPPLAARIDWRNGDPPGVFRDPDFRGRFRRRDAEGRFYSTWIETHERRILEIPLLLVSLLALLPVIVALLSRLARRQLPPGTCIECGYDLRYSTDRCPECSRPFLDRKPLRVALIAPILAAASVLSAVAIVLATISADRGMIVSGVRTPAFNHSWPDEPRPRVRIVEFAVWVEEGTILLAETHDVTSTINLPVASLADSATPPITRMPLLEPTLRVIPDGDRDIHVLRLPIWMALLLLVGSVAAWINRVRRRGGFYLGRLNPDPPLPEAPAAP